MEEKEVEEEVINITLDDDVSLALCRRGKLKLREIEASSRARLTMDASKRALEIRGSTACVADARSKILNLSGITLDTRPVVWAELMRTRTSTDIATAAIANIQEISGCRIHVKRDSTNIQLFGLKERTHKAAQLIERLDSMCGELSVGTHAAMSEDKLQRLAREFGVTLVVGKGNVNILGIKGAIAEAARALLYRENEGDAEPDVNEKLKGCDIARAAIEKVFSDLTTYKTKPLPSAPVIKASDVSTDKRLAEASQESGVRDATDLSIGSCSVCNRLPFCAQCGKRAEKMDRVYKGTCPSCLISKFCVHCGCEYLRHEQTSSTTEIL